MPAEPVFEVMVDYYGATPQYKRGDRLVQSECPYDLVWANALGAVRLLPTVEAEAAQDVNVTKTEPVNEQQRIAEPEPAQTDKNEKETKTSGSSTTEGKTK